ncbi:MAG: aspartate kinase [Armatimonadota bacterium]
MIVMKFGGTSIHDKDAVLRVIDIIKDRILESRNILVVVSAMGKVTNKLTEAAEASAAGSKRNTASLLKDLRLYHTDILKKVCPDKNIFNKALKKILKEFSRAEKYLAPGGKVFGKKHLTPLACDYVISSGEKLSSIIVHAALNSNNLKTKLVNAAEFMITDDNYSKANPLFNIVYDRIKNKLEPHFLKYSLVLTQGFIARTDKGIPSTIGREGSDCTATIIGNGLSAERIEIWTDVNGVMTADPRVVKGAGNIPVVSYDDMALLSSCGAKVIHPDTIAPAKSKNIPIYVLNSYNKNDKGTVINCRRKDKSCVNDIIAVTGRFGLFLAAFKDTGPEGLDNFVDAFLLASRKHKIAVDQVAVNKTRVAISAKVHYDRLKNIVGEFNRSNELMLHANKALIYIIGRNIVYTGMLRSLIDKLVEEGKLDIWDITKSRIALLADNCIAEGLINYLHNELMEKKTAKA